MKFLVIIFLVISAISCKQECKDPSNPDCENYSPCLFYQRPKAQILSYEYRNDLMVRSDSFLDGETARLVSLEGENFQNFWYDFANNKFKLSEEYYMNVSTHSYKGISLYKYVNRVEDCPNAVLLDTAYKVIHSFPNKVNNPSTNFPMINPVVNWYGKYNGIATGILNGKIALEIKPITLYKKNGDPLHVAKLEFLSDTCLGSYLIDNNYGIKWFSIFTQLDQIYICPNALYFQEIYGTYDNRTIKIIGKNEKKNYEFEFNGSKE